MDEMRSDLTIRIDGVSVLLTLPGGMAHGHERRITTLEGGTKR